MIPLSVAAVLCLSSTFACQSDAEKMCFDDSKLSKIKVSACGEACEKNNSKACVRQAEIANELCIENNDAEVCRWMCDYATVGKNVYCKALNRKERVEAPALTVDSLVATKGLVKLNEPWEQARGRLDALLGRSVYHDRINQWWAIIDGDECWGTTLMGDPVKEIMVPTKFSESDGLEYKHCTAAAGRNECVRRQGEDCYDKFPWPD